jgi:hypothetical protein
MSEFIALKLLLKNIKTNQLNIDTDYAPESYEEFGFEDGVQKIENQAQVDWLFDDRRGAMLGGSFGGSTKLREFISGIAKQWRAVSDDDWDVE